MTTEYLKTDDPNVFIKADTSKSFVYLDELTSSIEEMQQRIDDVPDPKTVPDQETLDFYNHEAVEIFGKDDLMAKLQEEQNLLDMLKNMKESG